MKRILILILLIITKSHANDSTGYVGTGGIEYLKNKNIAMQSEDLFISKKIIKVDYQFKNLSNLDIIETVLFPLPKLDNFFEGGDFAHSEDLLKSFLFRSMVKKSSLKCMLEPLSVKMKMNKILM